MAGEQRALGQRVAAISDWMAREASEDEALGGAEQT